MRTVYIIEFDYSIRTIRELNLTEGKNIAHMFNYDGFLQIQLKFLKAKNKINSAKMGLICWGWLISKSKKNYSL